MSNWGTNATSTDMTAQRNLQQRLNQTELELRKVKSEVDQADQVLRQVQSGHASPHVVQQKVHALTNSAGSLSGHVVSLRSMISESSSRSSSYDAADSETIIRGRRLLEQVLSQISRIQNLCRQLRIEYDKFKTTPTGGVAPGPGFGDAWPGQGQGIGDRAPRSDPLLVEFGDVTGGSPQGVHHPQHTQLQMQENDFAEEEQRARDMEKLESDIVQVNEIFSTLAGLVHEQGDVVDSIEANIDSGYNNVVAGNQQLASAVRYRNSARRKKCICAIIVISILVVIGLVIFLSVKYHQ